MKSNQSETGDQNTVKDKASGTSANSLIVFALFLAFYILISGLYYSFVVQQHWFDSSCEFWTEGDSQRYSTGVLLALMFFILLVTPLYGLIVGGLEQKISPQMYINHKLPQMRFIHYLMFGIFTLTFIIPELIQQRVVDASGPCR